MASEFHLSGRPRLLPFKYGEWQKRVPCVPGCQGASSRWQAPEGRSPRPQKGGLVERVGSVVEHGGGGSCSEKCRFPLRRVSLIFSGGGIISGKTAGDGRPRSTVRAARGINRAWVMAGCSVADWITAQIRQCLVQKRHTLRGVHAGTELSQQVENTHQSFVEKDEMRGARGGAQLGGGFERRL